MVLYPNDPLAKMLVFEEGFRPCAYQDSEGYWTIGFGTLIDARKGGGITREEAYMLLEHRVDQKAAELDVAIPWWRELDPVRRDVVHAMAYQMGLRGLMTFHNTLAAIRNGAWQAAAAGIRASQWYQQTPKRAERMAVAIETGLLP